MSGLFDDEGKTPARGRKNRPSTEAPELLADRPGDEPEPEIPPGHPFEASIKAAAVIADDIHPVAHEGPELTAQDRAKLLYPGHPVNPPEQGVVVHKNRSLGPSTVNQFEQVNRFPISQERRAKLLNLVWERTRWRTGRVEWRDFRELLKDVIELL